MKRTDGWEARMYEVLDEYRTSPLVYGVHDCGLFAARIVQALTGEDVVSRWLGAYATRAAAMRLVMERGGLPALVSAHLGESVAPERAQRGDILSIPHLRFGSALGVCDGPTGWFVGYTGLVTHRRRHWARCWRID